jgi:hypothetical protein
MPIHGEEALVLAGCAAWLALLLFTLTWLAARHWICAGLAATLQVNTALALVASFAIGPADIRLRWAWHRRLLLADLRYDYGQAWGWTTGKPWELYALVSVIFAWCSLLHRLRRRRLTQIAALVAAAQRQPQVIPVAPPWPPAAPPPGLRR